MAGIIIGVLSAIIAGIKGRKTFAICMAAWTILGLVTALWSSNTYSYDPYLRPSYITAPGWIFLIIAIALKKVDPTSPQDKPVVFYCHNCGFAASHASNILETVYCPKCGAALDNTDLVATPFPNLPQLNYKKTVENKDKAETSTTGE